MVIGLDSKIEEKIKEVMSRYKPEEFELYSAEAGWQDWMEEMIDEENKGYEELESKEIIEIEKQLWEEVHNVRP